MRSKIRGSKLKFTKVALSALLVLMATTSYANDLSILKYNTLMKTDQFDCKFETKDGGWFSPNEYRCVIEESKGDVVELQSDPYTNLIGRVHRYILINRSDINAVIGGVIKRYGKPKDHYVADDPIKQMLVWGDSTIELGGIIGNSKKGGVGLSLTFDECLPSTDCSDFFDDVSSEQIVADFMLMDSDQNSIMRESMQIGSDASVKEPSNNTKSTDTTKLKY